MSLKEKRMMLQSVMSRAQNKFNISIAEVEHNDIHKNAVIGIAVVSNERAHVDSVLSNVVRFIEQSTDAVVSDVFIEIL